MLQRGIDWKFQPPNASHFGGVFEREIRSVKKVLSGLLREQPIKLSDDLLSTLFCEIEGILNCRPLTELSQDTDDLEALTPNHLLLMNAGATFPPGLFTKSDCYSTRRWKQVQYLANLFWTRFRREYLPNLQKRQKWTNWTDTSTKSEIWCFSQSRCCQEISGRWAGSLRYFLIKRGE